MDQAQTRLPRRHYLSVAAIGVALAGAGVWYGAQGRRPRLKNVILISIDTLRADHLGYMGYDRPTSPAIDRFAAQSLDFHNAFTQAPETLPSHGSLFTSVYPSVHKAHVGNRLPLGEGFVTLAEHFRDGGFRTAAFVGGWQVAERWKLDQGFEVYEDGIPTRRVYLRKSSSGPAAGSRTIRASASFASSIPTSCTNRMPRRQDTIECSMKVTPARCPGESACTTA